MLAGIQSRVVIGRMRIVAFAAKQPAKRGQQFVLKAVITPRDMRLEGGNFLEILHSCRAQPYAHTPELGLEPRMADGHQDVTTSLVERDVEVTNQPG